MRNALSKSNYRNALGRSRFPLASLAFQATTSTGVLS